ncbi:hypothetical protein L227DRAFT_514200 [Lentinus tigrinus ALCF2SS1-6]|uniref:Uncharacterized protein n=1 Tax=Lentinus tigrinus ALCF2SS1-6 TaxID=1328759 RepID=A0A5C2RPH7_9APHY|nr:hypothetical protein L227DRAFT_514200 [Lentinus tigrinus ALCF2SS1-6]
MASASDASSLHGKLIHAATIFRLLCPFISRLGSFANSFSSNYARLHPPRSVVADLQWITNLLSLSLSTLPLSRDIPLNLGWWGDVSTSFGVGVVVGSFWAVWKWVPGFEVGPHHDHDIQWTKAVAVKLGL